MNLPPQVRSQVGERRLRGDSGEIVCTSTLYICLRFPLLYYNNLGQNMHDGIGQEDLQGDLS